MKITALKTYIVDSFRCNYVFLRMETDEGIHGIAEATLERKEKTVEAAIHDLENYLIGKDPRQVELHFRNMYRDARWNRGPVLTTALSAVEIAMWDIKGKALGVPVYELLGGRVNDKVRMYANAWFAGAKTPEEFAAKAKEAVERGFTALKWDPFGTAYMEISNRELQAASEQVGAVRDAVGWGVDLLIEGHGRFNLPSALRVAWEMEQYRPYCFEEPVPPDNYGAMAELKQRCRIPIAAGERCYTRFDFRDLFEKRAIDIAQPDIMHAGGFMECKRIAGMADAYYIPVSPHNPCGPVATAIALQFAACTPNFGLLETMANDVPWRSELTDERLHAEDGYMYVPDRPGLGIELNYEVFPKYPYSPKTLHHFDGRLTKIRPENQAVPYF